MKRSAYLSIVLVTVFIAFCTNAFASGWRLPIHEMEKIEKAAVVLDYWGLDGPNRSEDRLFLQPSRAARNHKAVPLSRKDFVRKLIAVDLKRDTVLVTLAVSVDPISDVSLDEAARFFQRCGFHRVVILLGEGSSPKNSGPLVLLDTAFRYRIVVKPIARFQVE